MNGRRRQLFELIEHFWTKVDRSGECWLWTGEVNNRGYGIFRVFDNSVVREKVLAHRVAALMAGMPVRTPKDVVMHACDTPRCVRPAHLTVKDQRANMQDAASKGRMNLDGLTKKCLRVCEMCSNEFSGVPSSRFCPACQNHIVLEVTEAAKRGESQYVTADRLRISQTTVRSYLKKAAS